MQYWCYYSLHISSGLLFPVANCKAMLIPDSLTEAIKLTGQH